MGSIKKVVAAGSANQRWRNGFSDIDGTRHVRHRWYDHNGFQNRQLRSAPQQASIYSPREATYAPLWCKSNFSFLEGASRPEELVATAQALGLRHIALTDRDGLYGAVSAFLEAKRLGIHLILGAQISLDDGSQVVLLARTHRGYRNLTRLVTRGRMRSPKGSSVVSWAELAEHAGDTAAIWVRGVGINSSGAAVLTDAFPRGMSAIGVARHRRSGDLAREARAREVGRHYGLPLVAAPEVLYHDPTRRMLQDTMTCIRHGLTLEAAGTRLRPNGEFALKSPESMMALYRDAPELLRRSLEIAESCTFSLSEIEYRYPSEPLPRGYTTATRLRELTMQGAAERYAGDIPQEVRAQLARELSVIEELDYCGYFITMWEIVDFCRKSGILCQGRGSAANSAVCYCLGITAIDPVRMNLLFERFLSRERAEPPDIDLDIEHNRREEVIQYVYRKYGRSHAAMVANIIRYRLKSAVRDVGAALGFSAVSLDRLAKLVSNREDNFDDALEQTRLAENKTLAEPFRRLVREILDAPRHLSIHPGGFLLGADPVCDIVPVENATMADRTVIQWDKRDVEAMNLFKVDLLGLGALTHLDYAFRLIRKHIGTVYSMASIPGGDPEVFAMISRADTVGVFQLESRAQMAMLPRLKPREFYDLVVEISIVRPGPITGGMVHPYLRRRAGEEPVAYPHPKLKPVLEKTLGVPLFQEQVMRLAVVAADYTPGEADQLRRDMAAWRKSGRIDAHRERLVTRMTRKGIEQAFAEQVFEQIRGFGEYGFPESHAASFASIAYCTAWVKTHYPAVFACALLNAWPMGFYAPSTVVEDARRHGVEVLPVSVLESSWECTLVPADGATTLHAGAGSGAGEENPGTTGDCTVTARSRRDRRWAVRMGLRYVKGLGRAEWQRIRAARARRPAALSSFLRHARLDEETRKNLARAGAFGCFGGERRSALWVAADSETTRAAVAGTAAVGSPTVDAAEPTQLIGADDTAPSPHFAPLGDYEMIAWITATATTAPPGIRWNPIVRSSPLAAFRAHHRLQPSMRAISSRTWGSSFADSGRRRPPARFS
ncbi:MAG: error-prone DNA polymerase [Spirochaetaceae bacterium]